MIKLQKEDFTVEVSGDTTLEELDAKLAEIQQTSLLEAPAHYNINQILLENIGDHNHKSTLGLTVEHQGSISKCGGQVIKNVSGYNLTNLYIGSYGKFGTILSAYLRTIKLTTIKIYPATSQENNNSSDYQGLRQEPYYNPDEQRILEKLYLEFNSSK